MFTTSKIALSAVFILTVVPAASAKDGSPPSFDIQKTCRAAERAISDIYGSVPVTAFDSCMSAEKGARDQLVKEWATFSQADVELCMRPREFQPSYVEWFTCAEMQRDVRKIRKEQPASAPPAPNARRQSSKSRLGSEARRCPVVELRADGSIVSVLACAVTR
jgi:hypothetical protein